MAIHVLTNISRSKDNMTMKYRQVTFFSKNNTQNVVDKLFPDLFLKNQISAYL